MSAPSSPSVPLRQALDRSEPLALLTRRLRDSQARLACVAPLIPVEWQSLVKAGPLDTEGWTLLVANGGVSAKLRQLLPRLTEAMEHHGWPAVKVRIRIAPESVTRR